MELATSFTELVGCRWPLQIAPMGVNTPALVVAGAQAGAFPLFATAGLTTATVLAMIDAAREQTDAPIGVNVLIPVLDRALVEAVAPRVQVFDFYHAPPDPSLVDLVHQAGARAEWQVGSVDEAMAAVDAGCDLLVVRGIEGGGRMYGDQPLLPLLNGVLDAVPSHIPVLAAGGLATARDLAGVLAMGAAGARMGTRFVATAESAAHDVYKQAVVDAAAHETALVTDFSVMWPNGPEPHRVLRRSLDAAAAFDGDVVGELDLGGAKIPIPKYAVLPPTVNATGQLEAFAMYAGTSVGSIQSVEPTADVVAAIVQGAARLLDR